MEDISRQLAIVSTNNQLKLRAPPPNPRPQPLIPNPRVNQVALQEPPICRQDNFVPGFMSPCIISKGSTVFSLLPLAILGKNAKLAIPILHPSQPRVLPPNNLFPNKIN